MAESKNEFGVEITHKVTRDGETYVRQTIEYPRNAYRDMVALEEGVVASMATFHEVMLDKARERIANEK